MYYIEHLCKNVVLLIELLVKTVLNLVRKIMLYLTHYEKRIVRKGWCEAEIFASVLYGMEEYPSMG